MRLGKMSLAAAAVVLLAGTGASAAPVRGTGADLVRDCRTYGIFGLAGDACEVLGDITATNCAELGRQIRERVPSTGMSLFSCADEETP